MASGYDRELLERALTVVWDDNRHYGIPNPVAPAPGRAQAVKGKSSAIDPAKRKGFSNPAHTGTHLAVIADVHQAWKHGGLNDEELAAVILRYGFDRKVRDIGEVIDLPKSTVADRIERGLQKMLAFLNGGGYDEESE